MKQYRVDLPGCEFDYYLFPFDDQGRDAAYEMLISWLDEQFGDLTDLGDKVEWNISVVDEPEPAPDAKP